jgi:hypothetical protein
VRTARRSTRELSPHPRPDCKQDDCKTRPENSQIACFARRLDAGNQPDWSLRWQSRRVRSLATRPPSVPAGSYLDARACVLLPTGPPTRLASAPSAFRGPSALAKQLEPLCIRRVSSGLLAQWRRRPGATLNREILNAAARSLPRGELGHEREGTPGRFANQILASGTHARSTIGRRECPLVGGLTAATLFPGSEPDGSLSRFGGKASRLMAVGLSGRGVVALFASVALGWRLETAFGVVVVE